MMILKMQKNLKKVDFSKHRLLIQEKYEIAENQKNTLWEKNPKVAP